MKLVSSSLPDERSRRAGLGKGVIAEGQVVLKSEWRRVKRGELTFVITKYVSLTLFVLAVCFAVLVGRGYLVITIHG